MTRKGYKVGLLTRQAQGFTLIELLIVIVIIGILAGVLIAVIDPAAQQNRARDANVKASINKVALSAQGFVSSYGYAPNDLEFLGAISNETEYNGSCDDADANYEASECEFSLTGITYGADCDSGAHYSPSGTANTQCVIQYERQNNNGGTVTESDFAIRAPSFGVANTYFEYRNYVGGDSLPASTILHCTGTTCSVPVN